MEDSNQNRSCLHFVVSATPSALTDGLNCRVDGDSMVFIDAGVMHLVAESGLQIDLNSPGLAFSREDLEARGLLRVARDRGVKILDDRGMVALLRNHEHCLTWK